LASDKGKYKYLAAFDFDSTLIDREVIDAIAELAGMHAQVSKITKMVVNGELPLEEALHDRATLLEGVTYQNLMTLGDSIKAMENIAPTMEFLKAHGFFIAIISASLNPVAARVASRREFSAVDQFLFNSLKMENGKLTGDVDIRVVDKGTIVFKLQQEHGIPKSHTLSVGDGSMDLPMFAESGLSIAFNAKEIAKKAAMKTVDGKDVAKIIPVVEDWLKPK
jgi:phosphoserine phosphatase